MLFVGINSLYQRVALASALIFRLEDHHFLSPFGLVKILIIWTKFQAI